MIKNGQLDLLPGLLKTPERTKLMGFIDTPIDSTEIVYQFFSLNASQQVKSLAELNPYTVGKRRDSSYSKAFDDDKNIEKLDFIDYETIIKMVLNRRIDYFIYAGSEIDELLVTLDTDQQLKPAQFVVTERKYGYLAASKAFESSLLSQRISEGLAQMIKDGTLLTLAQKNKVESALEPPE